MRAGRFYLGELPGIAIALALGLRQQLRESEARAGIAHHGIGVQAIAVGHEHAGRAPVLDQDFLHLGIGEHLAAGSAYHRDDAVGDAPGPAHGIIAAVEIVLHHRRVHHERSVARHHAVIAPLAGEHADELLVLREPFEHLAHRLEAGLGQHQRTQRVISLGGETRHRLPCKEFLRRARHAIDEFEVGVYRLRLVRKLALERSREVLAAGNEIDRAAADDNAVVHRIHRRPLELPVRDHVEYAAQRVVRLVHLADVMHAHVPFETLALIGVGEAARGVVLLEHAHPAPEPGLQRRGAQAADAGTDHDAVVVRRRAPAAVTVTSAFHANPRLAIECPLAGMHGSQAACA